MRDEYHIARERSSGWLHTRAFALPAYLLAVLIGYYTGILGYILASELFNGYRIDYNELIMMPITAGAVLAVTALEILPMLALASILMVPATVALLALARRFNVENPYFAAPSGVLVAAIFAVTLELAPDSGGSVNLFQGDVKELIGAVLLGGACAGLTYWGYIKVTGLLGETVEAN